MSSKVVKKLTIPVNLLRRSARNKSLPEKPAELDTSCDLKVQEIPSKRERVEVDPSKTSKKIKSETICPIEDNKNLVIDNLPNPDGTILVDEYELDLERTLLGGQSFRWFKKEYRVGDNKPLPMFSGIILDHIVDLWRISPTEIAFKRINNSQTDCKVSSTKALLEDYFQLKYKLRDLYKEWSAGDEHLAKCCQEYTGFRILRQDPVENVFSFICATNNNIKRISQMVDKMCKKYGEQLNIKSKNALLSLDDPYRSFPTVERLAEDDVFDCLRYQLGFGYRAKYINGTAKQIIKLSKEKNFASPRDYLLSLRQLPYKETCKQLMQFSGIGRKVADCICLMSMDHLNSVPTDCHIYEIVCRNYMPTLRQKHKTLNDAVHDLIEDHFRNLHGPLAGWSTSVLFISELKHLKLSKDGAKEKDDMSVDKTKKSSSITKKNK